MERRRRREHDTQEQEKLGRDTHGTRVVETERRKQRRASQKSEKHRKIEGDTRSNNVTFIRGAGVNEDRIRLGRRRTIMQRTISRDDEHG